MRRKHPDRWARENYLRVMKLPADYPNREDIIRMWNVEQYIETTCNEMTAKKMEFFDRFLKKKNTDR